MSSTLLVFFFFPLAPDPLAMLFLDVCQGSGAKSTLCESLIAQ